MKYETFCGGVFETNCYLFHAPEGTVLFDAPDGSCAWLQNRGVDLKLLILTHGHVDHVIDVAKIKRKFNCPIGCHPDTAPMISDPNFFRNFGFGFDLEPVTPDFFIEETPEREFLGANFKFSKFPAIVPGAFAFSCAAKSF
jgi:glyoxylase-like metal-dependent hydrolase (beta-lactamase superfamily II)